MKNSLWRIAGLVITIYISIQLILNLELYPFLYASLLWIIFSIVIAITAKKEKLKLAAIYFASAMLAFGLAEAYYWGMFKHEGPASQDRTETVIISGGGTIAHDLLGYAPTKNSLQFVKEYNGNSLLYEVTQTIDQYGWRAIPESTDKTKEAALFFGGSFTFGQGIDDDETTAYQFQELSGGKYKAFNLGYGGYGPHQMLAILENNLEVEAVKNYQPMVAMYQAIPDHIYRIKGNSGWDYFGPKYELSENGKIEYQGSFNSYLKGTVIQMIRKSSALSGFLPARNERSNEDLELMIQIINKSAQTFEERYGSEFYVLLWEEALGEQELYENILHKLKTLDIKVIEVKDILNNYDPESQLYFISGDNHPNAYAHKLVARYLVDLF